MDDDNAARNLYRHMSISTLKAFVFIIFPVAIVGQASVVISKFSEGLFNTDFLGLPSFVIQLCCLATMAVMLLAMRFCWQELQSRKR